jgi:hypothetical protein
VGYTEPNFSDWGKEGETVRLSLFTYKYTYMELLFFLLEWVNCFPVEVIFIPRPAFNCLPVEVSQCWSVQTKEPYVGGALVKSLTS